MKHFQYNDGGRTEAGFKGKSGDCVCRAISIAKGISYNEVVKRMPPNSSAIDNKFKEFVAYMLELKFAWVLIEKERKIYLGDKELLKGRLVVHLNKHVVAMIDGVMHDTVDPLRFGKRLVLGYWVLEG